MPIQANLRLAPSGDLADVLLAVIEGVAEVNVLWIRRCIARGLVPPCCTGCAEPPWVESPVRHVNHHGKPSDTAREYRDGPTMFHLGEGTCADVVAYDAAAHVVEGHDVRIALETLDGENEYHAVVYVDGERKDPSAAMQAAATNDTHNVGRCGCKGEP